MTTSFTKGALASALLTLALSACGQESTETKQASEPIAPTQLTHSVKILHKGNTSEPDSLDPNKATGTWESSILRDMIFGLYTEDAYGEAIPGSAVSHSVSDDGLIYTFKMREGMVWSDGVPVTAHDFVYGMRRILNPSTASQYASLLYVIENAAEVNTGDMPGEALGSRAIDDMTLEITLVNPAPFFIEMTTHQTMYPLPKHVVEAHGDQWVRPENVQVNGPYKLVEWVPQGHIRLIKNELYYAVDELQIDEIYYYPTVDRTAALKQFRAGELDMNSRLPLQQIDWLQENMPDETRLYPYMGLSYIIFNTEAAPFDDVRVRTALSMVIERDVITSKSCAVATSLPILWCRRASIITSLAPSSRLRVCPKKSASPKPKSCSPKRALTRTIPSPSLTSLGKVLMVAGPRWLFARCGRRLAFRPISFTRKQRPSMTTLEPATLPLEMRAGLPTTTTAKTSSTFYKPLAGQ